MNTQTNYEISVEMLKALALCQHDGTPYFFCDGKFYEGNEKNFHAEWVEATENLADAQNWPEFVADNCTEIEETDSDGEKDNYLILTDEEADEKAADYIKDSLWAFTPDFLAEMTDFDPEVFEAIAANGKCKDNNDVIYNTIRKTCGIETFVEAAIQADGRGHFMSSYDGEENEETVAIDDETGKQLHPNDSAAHTFYIYRIN